MRSIETELKNRLLSNQQTLFNNANPYMSVIVSRPRTAITNKNYWQETVVADDVIVTQTSIAVRRQFSAADKVYVAYIANNILTVKSAILQQSVSQMVWQTVENIVDCSCVALAFDGSFVHTQEKTVEWRTAETPTLFYVTIHGQLLYGELGSEYESLVGGGVTAVDVVHGVESQDKTDSQGLIVFYITNGKLYSTQYIQDAWEAATQVQLEGLPETIVAVHAERTFDYRIVLHVKDNTGKIYEVFSKMEAHGWHANETIKTKITTKIDFIPVEYSSYTAPGEAYVQAAVENNRTEVGSIYSPFMYKACNIDNGSGDYGKYIEIEWSENIYVHNSIANSFRITDTEGVVQYAQNIVSTDGWRKIVVEFINFNNFVGELLLEYEPGLVSGCATAVTTKSIVFTPTNLIPYYLPGPEMVSAENIQDWSEA